MNPQDPPVSGEPAMKITILQRARKIWMSSKGWLLVTALFLVGLFFLIQNDLASASGEQQFVYLAQSFLKGHLDFVEPPGDPANPAAWSDTSLFGNRHYWPLGPVPALVLMPAVALAGLSVQQGYFLFVINLLNLVLLYRISLGITNNRSTSLWLAFAYVFSTAYLYIALSPWSWYFAQAVATLFLLLALHQFLGPKRWWLIGVYLGLAIATRVNLVLAAAFFAGSIILEAGAFREKLRSLLKLSLPVVVSLLVLLGYNYLRFGSFSEFGYHYQSGVGEENRQFGLWSFVHFPANLYYFLFKGPEAVFLPETKVLTFPFLQADMWGMSIVFTSPILLWGLRAPAKQKLVYLSIATSLLLLFCVVGYYGIGARQFGYRYALDFYPFLFLMLASAARERLTMPMKTIITASFVFNSYLLLV